MKIHSFITTFARNGNQLTITDTKTVHQMNNVLKFEKGEEVYIGDGKNIRYRAKIVDSTKKQIILNIESEELPKTTLPEIIIALATIKRDNFEYAIEKMTEVGVDGILPLSTDKVIKKGVNIERTNIIIREASEQSMRIKMPVLLDELNLQQALDYFIKQNDVQLVFCDMPNDESPSKVSTPKRVVNNPKAIVFFIGPEGGWSDRERLSIELLGVPNYSLGETVLRAETAAIITAFLAINNKL